MAERSEQSDDTHTTTPNHDGKGKLRQKILLGLFCLALVALAYDFMVARPGVEQAYKKVEEANAATNSGTITRLTDADVQQLLGRQPSETYEEGPYTVELYAWTAGLPVGIKGSESRSPGFGLRTHDYYAVYSKNPSGTGLLFQTHHKFKMDSAEPKRVVVVDGESDSDTDMTGMMMMGGGGGGGEGGFDPAAIFDRRDENADGKLTGDELSGRMADRVEEFDTDGNGEISQEEFGAGMAAAFAGGGGPGAGGPSGGGFDPSAIFDRRDENSDGKLTGEELSGRIADRVEQLDADKNGEISREEFDQGMQNAFSGGGPGGSPSGPGGFGGGRGGGGEGNRPERPKRPQLDKDAADDDE